MSFVRWNRVTEGGHLFVLPERIVLSGGVVRRGADDHLRASSFRQEAAASAASFAQSATDGATATLGTTAHLELLEV